MTRRLPGHTLRYSAAAMSDVGRVRTRNEDAWLDRPDLGLWVVADGMGGHSAGAYASNRIVDALHEIDPPADPSGFMTSVRNCLAEVDTELRSRAETLGPGAVIASTVVALLLFDRHYACVWAGDSRAYLLRNGIFRQVTHDHSRVQELVDGGLISQEQALRHPQGNVVTRAIGAGGDLRLDSVQDRLIEGDIFLLCSDGLSRMVSDEEIAALLASGPPTVAGSALVDAALERGATDNVTVVVVHAGD